MYTKAQSPLPQISVEAWTSNIDVKLKEEKKTLRALCARVRNSRTDIALASSVVWYYLSLKIRQFDFCSLNSILQWFKIAGCSWMPHFELLGVCSHNRHHEIGEAGGRREMAILVLFSLQTEACDKLQIYNLKALYKCHTHYLTITLKLVALNCLCFISPILTNIMTFLFSLNLLCEQVLSPKVVNVHSIGHELPH